MKRGWFKWVGLKRQITTAATDSPSRPALSLLPDEDLLQVLSAAELLATPVRRQQLNDIERLAGIPDGHFKALYMGAIESYACWVQQLPASEAHHHAGAGGMLDHALEVTVTAMSKRRVHLLPHGAEPEVISRRQHRWTYAVFSAALLHDVGKPAVDQTVMFFDETRRQRNAWDPWSGPMATGMWYRVSFVRGRRYRMHEAVTPLLARLILPPAGISWLAEDHEVLTEWLAAISGDREQRGVVAEIVEQADGESVARNLGATDVARFPAARMIPLHERLLTGLRHLLSTNALPLNRNGSAGWLLGDDLWLVSKRAIDTLRDHMLQEGHSGIPNHNERIFDELQQHRLLTPNGERAIWTAQVTGDGWSHSFTLLRFRASRIWPDSNQRPEPFAGTITPVDKSVDAVASEGQPITMDVNEPSTITLSDVNMQHSEAMMETAPLTIASDADTSPVINSTANMQPDKTNEKEKDGDLGKEFLEWLIESAATGRIRINKADARIHVVPEGLLLVSPGIFKDFARAINQPNAWDRAQGGFCRLGMHLPAANGSNIFHYKVQLPDGNHNKKTQVLKGIVMTDPHNVLKEKIQPNPILRRVE